MRRALLIALLGACGHSAGSGLKPMVDSPVIKFKAPDEDAIQDITGIDPSETPATMATPAEGPK